MHVNQLYSTDFTGQDCAPLVQDCQIYPFFPADQQSSHTLCKLHSTQELCGTFETRGDKEEANLDGYTELSQRSLAIGPLTLTLGGSK